MRSKLQNSSWAWRRRFRKDLQIISPQRPLPMGGLSFGLSLGQHWLLNLDCQSIFKSQKTPITWIAIYPVAWEIFLKKGRLGNSGPGSLVVIIVWSWVSSPPLVACAFTSLQSPPSPSVPSLRIKVSGHLSSYS